MNEVVKKRYANADIQITVNKYYDRVRKEYIAMLLKEEFSKCRVNPPSIEQLTYDVEEVYKIKCSTCALRSLFQAARKRQMERNVLKPLSVAELEYVSENCDYTTPEDRTTKYKYLPHQRDVELLQSDSFLKLKSIWIKNGGGIPYREVGKKEAFITKSVLDRVDIGRKLKHA